MHACTKYTHWLLCEPLAVPSSFFIYELVELLVDDRYELVDDPLLLNELVLASTLHKIAKFLKVPAFWRHVSKL
jgi:hypothetical protein